MSIEIGDTNGIYAKEGDSVKRVVECKLVNDGVVKDVSQLYRQNNNKRKLVFDKRGVPINVYAEKGVSGQFTLPLSFSKTSVYLTMIFKIHSPNCQIYKFTDSFICSAKNSTLYINSVDFDPLELDTWYTIVHGYGAWRYRQSEGIDVYKTGYLGWNCPSFSCSQTIVGDENVEILAVGKMYGIFKQKTAFKSFYNYGTKTCGLMRLSDNTFVEKN